LAEKDSRPFFPGPHRSGFTIIEVMVAAGLTTLLMAAMYSAMSVYWTTAVESYDEIERSQIARALLRSMARDIQSCTFREEEDQATSEDDDLLLGDLDTTAAEPVDPDAAMAAYTNGLVGTDTDLMLYISRPDKNQSYVSAQELATPSERSSDAIIVRYFLAERGGVGLSGMVAEEALAESTSDSNVAGLAIMHGDQIGLSTAMNLGDIDLQMEAADLLAREVAAIRFSYFDGMDEFEEWDSKVKNAMPRAVIIEVTLRTLLPESETRDPEDVPGWISETVHRLVVPVPVSDPMSGMQTL